MMLRMLRFVFRFCTSKPSNVKSRRCRSWKMKSRSGCEVRLTDTEVVRRGRDDKGQDYAIILSTRLVFAVEAYLNVEAPHFHVRVADSRVHSLSVAMTAHQVVDRLYLEM